MGASRGYVAEFVDRLQRQGRYTFALPELAASTSANARSVSAAITRLIAKGRLRRFTAKGDFFIIVPHEHHSLGAPPVAWVLEDYMHHLGLSYYVGLLSAAEWHGSAHFAVQELQVVVSKQLRPAQIGRTRVHFVVKRAAADTPVETRATEAGSVRVSTVEATLLDMVRYPRAVGGLNRIATIATDLGRLCRPAAMQAALDAANDPRSTQRLGYLLEKVGFKAPADVARRWVAAHRHALCPLEPALPAKGPRRPDWDVIENTTIEAAG